MLVLTRRNGESIVIGNEVSVTVVEVRGDQVRLGISAPRSVQVYREEVYREIERQNAQAVADAGQARSVIDRGLPHRPGRTGGAPRPGPGPRQRPEGGA